VLDEAFQVPHEGLPGPSLQGVGMHHVRCRVLGASGDVASYPLAYRGQGPERTGYGFWEVKPVPLE
jgi:hypothetical protein